MKRFKFFYDVPTYELLKHFGVSTFFLCRKLDSLYLMKKHSRENDIDPHLTYLQMYLMCVPIVELIFSDLVFLITTVQLAFYWWGKEEVKSNPIYRGLIKQCSLRF